MPPQTPYGSRADIACARHGSTTGQRAQTCLAASSRATLDGPRSPSGWKNRLPSCPRHAPLSCHSQKSAFAPGSLRMSAIPIPPRSSAPSVKEEVPPTTRPYNRAVGCSSQGRRQLAAPSGGPDDEPVPAEPGASSAPEPPEGRLTVAAVARRLGVAPATLRTWDRRNGPGPPLHSAGSHRRYSRSDIARLETMRRLVLDGVPPAEAARLAIDHAAPPGADDGPPPGPSGRLSRSDGARPDGARPDGARPDGALADGARPDGARPDGARPDGARPDGARPDGARPGGPGGRVLALPGGSAESRGLARAAMALDAVSMRAAVDRALAEHGVIPTWTELLCPVLVAVGERWAATGEGVEVEHLLAETAGSALRAVSTAPEPRNGRPVLLACAPEEQHSLPLSALAAALAEQGIGARLLGGGLPLAALRAAVRRTGPAALMVWAHAATSADARLLDALPVLRPPVTVLAGGVGWIGRPLPARVSYVPDLVSAVGLVSRAVGG